jgi:hypothetical protein
MNRIRLHAPEISGRSVRFRWEVAPRTNLYRAHAFTLRFGADIDISRLPEPLWWTIAVICLHPHWTLLRPCRIELPVTLDPDELELWRRLLEAEVTTLESLRGTRDYETSIEIAGTGPRLSPPMRLPDSGRCAAAFSGGKDSLLQAALLAELTEEAVLVTTTSPMPPLQDHVTQRRRYVLSQIPQRLPVKLVEVGSTFRASWDNHFADRQGYPIAVNEMTDTFLYLGALLAVGAAVGATHLFLASEAELQETAERDGRIIQHQHYMYSVATQRALQALLARSGFRYGSLTSPLHSSQVQRLLWTRYPNLSDLQYSCWRVRERQATCSGCGQCLRVALTALAMGRNPERMGIDLVALFPALAEWSPSPEEQLGEDLLPTQRVARRLHGDVVRSVAETPALRVARAILESGWRRALSGRARRAVRAYSRLRRRLMTRRARPADGYRAGFLRTVDPLLRDRIGAIYAANFEKQPESGYEDLLTRCDRLARWMAEPLGGET